MWVAMSRGTAVGVLAATFAAGGAAGWLLRGGPTTHVEPPTLTALPPGSMPPNRDVGRDTGREPARGTVPPLPTKGTGRVGPAGTVQVKAVPTPGHYVRLNANETLSEIAQRAYGSTKRLPDLLEANPLLDPKRLQPGTLVYVPVGTEDVPPAPPPLPPSALPPMKTPAPKPAAAPKASPTPTPATGAPSPTPTSAAAVNAETSAPPAAPPAKTK